MPTRLPVPHRPQQIPSLPILYLQASLDDVRGWLADGIPVTALVQTLELPYQTLLTVHSFEHFDLNLILELLKLQISGDQGRF